MSIGCNFASDPSAVSRGAGRIDVVAVTEAGSVQRLKSIDGRWYAPLTIRGGSPAGGLKRLSSLTDYIGPAIASRGPDLLDVFVVRWDGLLSLTTWSAGNWSEWTTLGMHGYDVTARPAAVALSQTEVQLAINSEYYVLFEPLLTFAPGMLSFIVGQPKATTYYQAAPALTTRNSDTGRYRVLVTNGDGRISHRVSDGSWRDIGGIPKRYTGIAAVATGDFRFVAIINGEDATSCFEYCAVPAFAPLPRRTVQPGGLWIRHFD